MAALGLAENLAAVRRSVAEAAARAGRDPAAVTLIAVSKSFPAEAAAAAVAAGARDLGENRVQEAREKIAAVPAAPGLRWHLIGRLQTNKVRLLGDAFALVHSVDREDLVEALARRLEREGRTQAVLMQVNASGEATKAGVAIEDALALARRMVAAPSLRLQGLMTIAPLVEDPEAARPCFAALRRLRERLQEDLGQPLPELSMGMSGDYAVAVQEGATCVRIGRAIFGERPAPA